VDVIFAPAQEHLLHSRRQAQRPSLSQARTALKNLRELFREGTKLTSA
jgi:hypothetical protein